MLQYSVTGHFPDPDYRDRFSSARGLKPLVWVVAYGPKSALPKPRSSVELWRSGVAEAGPGALPKNLIRGKGACRDRWMPRIQYTRKKHPVEENTPDIHDKVGCARSPSNDIIAGRFWM